MKLGVLNDMSGVYSDYQGIGSVVAAQMAAEDFGGKVAGVAIEVVSADHQNQPDIGATIARKWFDIEGVDVVLDVPNSATRGQLSFVPQSLITLVTMPLLPVSLCHGNRCLSTEPQKR